MQLGSFVFQVLVGLLLLWSGSEHLKNPQYFLISVIRYDLFSETVARLIAFAMPSIELLLGVCLVSNFTPRVTLLLGSQLFFGFGLLQLIALTRGLEIDCGCFGSATDRPISLTSAGINGVISVTFLIFWHICKSNSNDSIRESNEQISVLTPES